VVQQQQSKSRARPGRQQGSSKRRAMMNLCEWRS